MGVTYKEFRVGDLFEMVNKTAKSKFFEKSSEPTTRFTLPATSAKTTNNMWGYYVDPNDHNAINKCITVTANGMGYATYQPENFAISQDSYALFLKGAYGGNIEKVYKYFTVVLRKLLLDYDYNRKSGWARFSEDVVSLPTTPSGQLDFDYMENYIKEIEQKHIQKLEVDLDVRTAELLKIIGGVSYSPKPLSDKV